MNTKINQTRTRLRELSVRVKVSLDSLCRGDESGQDLIEYALMAGFVAVAVGTTFPTTMAPAMSTIFSKVYSSLGSAASGS